MDEIGRGEGDVLEASPVRTSVHRYFDYIGDRGGWGTGGPNHVRIDDERVEECAEAWADEEFPLPDWRAPVFPDESAPGVSPADVVDFIFVGNAVNFAFRDFDSGERFAAEYDGTRWSGAFGMWACLKRAFDAGEPITAGDYLSTLTREDVAELFASAGDVEMPMLEERAQILRDIGATLEDSSGGQFHKFLGGVGGTHRAFVRPDDHGVGIVERLAETFPSYDDAPLVSVAGRATPAKFHKRAQLAVAMCYGRFRNTPHFALEDPGALTVFADYNLPNVLRHLGVLEYDDHLAELVDTGQLLDAEGLEETVLRAATVVAADRLIEGVNARRATEKRRVVYAPQMDYKLFSLRDQAETPFHKTRTTAY